MDQTSSSPFAAFRTEEGAQCWHWDEDAQHEWCAAIPDWQELCSSWYKSIPEPGQTFSVSGVGLYFVTSRILARDAYASIASKILKHRQEAPGAGALIIGQAGSGKGFFVWYLLRILLMIDEPVVLAYGVYCRLFYKGRVYAPRSMGYKLDPRDLPRHSKSKPMWLLADEAGEREMTLPLDDPLVFPVKTSVSHLGCAEAWATRRDAARIGIPLWSQRDLIDSFTLHDDYRWFHDALQDVLEGSSPDDDMRGVVSWLNKRHPGWRRRTVHDLIETLAEDATRRVGPIARDAHSFILNPMRSTIFPVALGLGYQVIMESLVGPGGGLTDNIFAIIPSSNPQDPMHDTFICDFKSRVLAKEAKKILYTLHFRRNVESSDADTQHRQLFKECWKGQRTSVLATCLFVNIARYTLLGCDRPKYPISAMDTTDGTNCIWKPAASNNRLQYLSLPRRTIMAYDPSLSPLKIDVEHVFFPAAIRNSATPTCDAFFLEADRGAQRATLWVVQSTFNAACNSKPDDRIRIRDLILAARAYLRAALPRNTSVAKRRKMNAGDAITVELNLVLAHPEIQDRQWSWTVPDEWIEDWRDCTCEPHVYHLPISV
ncbi:hypothetical protein OH76DRAFT_1554083 [Lentinus brumalis]|uniref:Uncharacterized protein n=1 Tax=Lentinus brumalis TaxID=2498619 RepID=A0A371DK43_9APHY|nr:hypothetical protein OH76DRAFT_1554083 [Polyporus brumalis]